VPLRAHDRGHAELDKSSSEHCPNGKGPSLGSGAASWSVTHGHSTPQVSANSVFIAADHPANVANKWHPGTLKFAGAAQIESPMCAQPTGHIESTLFSQCLLQGQDARHRSANNCLSKMPVNLTLCSHGPS